jgi:hypothetical protein
MSSGEVSTPCSKTTGFDERVECGALDQQCNDALAPLNNTSRFMQLKLTRRFVPSTLIGSAAFAMVQIFHESNAGVAVRLEADTQNDFHTCAVHIRSSFDQIV